MLKSIVVLFDLFRLLVDWWKSDLYLFANTIRELGSLYVNNLNRHDIQTQQL